MRIATLSLLLACTAAPALAQVTTKAPAAVHAGEYAIEPTHTRIAFSLSHMGFTTWYGDFTGASGDLTLNPGSLPKAR